MRYVVEGRSGRLDVAICDAVPELSRSRAAALIRAGAVTVDGEVRTKSAAKIGAGAVLEIEVPEPVPLDVLAEDIPLDIVYEDADLMVINKAPGMVVHPSPGHGSGTLVNAILFHAEHLSGIGGVARPGIVHRLDKGTSGLIIVAKSDRAHQGMTRQFAAHSPQRVYIALCLGVPVLTSGTVRNQLGRDPRDRMRFASTTEGGKEACTHWRVLGRGDRVSLIECRLETGRTHQIRVHLAEKGWPIAGDPLYKRRWAQPTQALRPHLRLNRPLLHAWQLRFAHPVSQEPMRCVAPAPEDFQAAVSAVQLLGAIPSGALSGEVDG
jgi:23S rRNA pseudouridine1911/1915/1917 synthase